MKLWKKKLGFRATYRNLLEVFVNSGHTSCAEVLCELLRKKCELWLLHDFVSDNIMHIHTFFYRSKSPVNHLITVLASIIVCEIANCISNHLKGIYHKIVGPDHLLAVRIIGAYRYSDLEKRMLDYVKSLTLIWGDYRGISPSAQSCVTN